jgi:hypothetical protein
MVPRFQSDLTVLLEEKLYVMDLLGKKIIQPSSSEWAAAPVICMKKDGTILWIIETLTL